MLKIYIIRHGETDLNEKGVLQGWLDEPLNPNGKNLASIVGQKLKGIHFDNCISSPLLRAKETVEIIIRESGNNLRISMDDRLKEISFGELEGKKLSVMGEKGKTFFSDPFGFTGFPGGECIMDVCIRTQAFLEELINSNDDKTYLIGTHGCALRAMLNQLYDDPDDFWHGHVPYNCSVSVIEVKDNDAKIISDDQIYYPSELLVDRYPKH